MTLLERAATTRQSLLNKTLQKKEKSLIPSFSLSRPLKDDVATTSDIQTIQNDAEHCPQLSAASESKGIIEVKPGIHIPRPTKELSLYELIAIAEKFQDPNEPYVGSMKIGSDGMVVKYYSDGTVRTKITIPIVSEKPFSPEMQMLINWFRSEKNLPTAPFTRSTGFVSPQGKYNTNLIKDHKAYYDMIKKWIALGSQAKINTTGLLKEELEALKALVDQSAERRP